MTDPQTKAAVTDAIVEVKTGINMTQRRMQQQHAADFEAQAKLRDAQTAREVKNQTMADEFVSGWVHQGGKMFPDANGKLHPVMWDPLKKVYYNPNQTMGGGKEEKPETRPYTTKQGTFDAVEALKDAKARAESNDEFFKTDEKGKRTMNAEGHDWIKRTVQGRESNWFKAKSGPADAAENSGQAQAGNDQREQPAPQQVEHAQKIDTVAQRIASDKSLAPEQKQFATNALAGMKEIVAKYPNLAAAPTAVQKEFKILEQMYRLNTAK